MNKQFKTDAQDFLNSVQVLREVQTPESENHMYDELMQVKFLMPVVIHGELKEGADGKQILDEKTDVYVSIHCDNKRRSIFYGIYKWRRDAEISKQR